MNEKTVAKYMREMGIMAIYPGPNLSKRAYQAGIYPYLRNYSGARFPGDGKRRAFKNSRHGSQQRATLFAHGGKITANGAKGRRSPRAAKGARNFLLDLDHPQIALGEVVGKRNREIIQEREDLLGSFEQGIQEIFRVALFWSSQFFGQGRSTWLAGCKALLKHLKIPQDQGISLGFGNRFGSGETPLMSRVEHAQEQVVHGLRPGVIFLLGDAQTISQQMRSAEAVLT
jgi:hypothetical protein